MDRRDTLLAFLALSAAPLASIAQQQRKVWRIGILSTGNPRFRNDDDLFIKAMGELGYVRGKDYVFEGRFAEFDLTRLPALAADLVLQRVDLIMPVGTQAAIAARNATREVPIVLTGVRDPVGSGLATSLSRPGGNVTGFSSHTQIVAKYPDLLRQLVPGMLRIGLLHNPNDVVNVQERADLESGCRQLAMRLISAPVGNPDEIVKAFSHLKREKAQGLVVFQGTTIVGAEKRIVELAANHRLPAIYGNSDWVDEGGLVSYTPNFDDLLRRVAACVDRIFKGAKPGDLPIEQPTTFKLAINRKTAKALGLTIPQSLLILADRVVG